MSREKHIPSDNQWVAFDDFDASAFRDAVYQQVGGRFPMGVRANGEVTINPDELPSGISENDAKQAIRDNHPHR